MRVFAEKKNYAQRSTKKVYSQKQQNVLLESAIETRKNIFTSSNWRKLEEVKKKTFKLYTSLSRESIQKVQ